MAAPAVLGLVGRAGIAPTTLGKLSQFGNLVGGAKGSLPKLEEEIDVRCWGGPASTRLRLYRLAMAVVWGKIQRRDLIRALPPPGMLLLEYNLEARCVRIVCRLVTTYSAALLGRARGRREIELFQGPADVSKGGEWGFTSVLPGTPGAPGIEPKNGFEGRTILTPNPTYQDAAVGAVKVSRSPTPPGDRLSRGTANVANDPTVRALDTANWYTRPDHLLWAALSQPCAASNLRTPVYAPTPLTPTPTPAPGYPPPNSEPTPTQPSGQSQPPSGSASQSPADSLPATNDPLNPLA